MPEKQGAVPGRRISESREEGAFGPWMMVQRKNRPRTGPRREHNGGSGPRAHVGQKGASGANRFEAFHNAEGVDEEAKDTGHVGGTGGTRRKQGGRC